MWGDASLRNMLFDGLRPVALMDFEFAHVGLCDFDIVFYALMDPVMARGFAGGVPDACRAFPASRKPWTATRISAGARCARADTCNAWC